METSSKDSRRGDNVTPLAPAERSNGALYIIREHTAVSWQPDFVSRLALIAAKRIECTCAKRRRIESPQAARCVVRVYNSAIGTRRNDLKCLSMSKARLRYTSGLVQSFTH